MSKITRRDFLKLTVVSATAASTTGLVACSGSGKGGSITLPIDNGYFPQSVASGDPTPDSVILWARILDAARPGANLTAILQWADDAAFTTNVKQVANLNVLSANDNCLKVKVTGLADATAPKGKTLYYRFIYTDQSGTNQISNVGRTKTAPATTEDAEVNYAVLSCQDYIGRYYNTLKRLVELSEEAGNDLDFVVHVGDYIYETTGDASFQNVGGGRSISFTDSTGAITVTDPLTGKTKFQAASSLSNYRQLYKTYRTDQMLQRVHERFPMISTWDDHEYSDDCHQDTATYLDGAKNTSTGTDPEKNTQRRVNAEQAYFDFMPVEPQAGTISGADGSVTTDTSMLFPNAKLYRNFNFGQNLDLIVTDFRSYRPDHLIPEDGNPGTVILDDLNLAKTLLHATKLKVNPNQAYATTDGVLGNAPDALGTFPPTLTAGIGGTDTTAALNALPVLIQTATGVAPAAAAQIGQFGYFTLNGKTLNSGQEALFRTAIAGGMIGEGQTGPSALARAYKDFPNDAKVSIAFYSGLVTAFNTTGNGTLPTAKEVVTKIVTDTANLTTATMITQGIGYGLSYALLGKQNFFSSFGSRYLVVKDTYDLYALFKGQIETQRTSAIPNDIENPLGAAQWGWLVGQTAASTAKYVGIANSTSTSSLLLDFRPQGADIDGDGDTDGGFLTTAQASVLPVAFRQRFYLNVDHWDGFPWSKSLLVGTLAASKNAATNGIFLMAGDIHATYLADNTAGADHIPDFTGPSVASGTFGKFIEDAFNTVSASFDATAVAAGKDLVVAKLDKGLDPTNPKQGLLQLGTNGVTGVGGVGATNGAKGSPGSNALLETRSREHGFVTFKVISTGVTSTYHLVAESTATQNLYTESATATKARFNNEVKYNYTSIGAVPAPVV